MRHLCSLKQFLATGRLGPISTDLNLRQVADLLGTPQDWIFNHDAPFYWIYSEGDRYRPYLELDFSAEPPHEMYWFQIENAEDIRDEFCLFGQMLAMTTDGLSGSSRPSDFLRCGAFDEASTVIHLSKYLELTIISGPVSIHFAGAESFEDELSDEAKEEIFATFGGACNFAHIDRLMGPGDIYSHRDLQRASQDHVWTSASCSLRQYLSMIDGSRTTTAR